MSRKLLLTVTMLAGGLLAVGCGQVTEATKKANEAAKTGVEKAKEGADKAKEGAAIAQEAGLEAVKKGHDEAKALFEKEISAVEKKWGELKAKMEAEKDAAQKNQLGKIVTEGESKLTALKKMISEQFTVEKLNNLADFTKMKDEILTKIAELKKTLGM